MCQTSDEEFISRFESGVLPPASFHHADHVRMAFLFLTRYPVLEALDRFSKALRGLAAASGKPELYHETITWAYLLLIRERMARAAAEQTLPEFKAGNPDLLDWKNNILKKFYRGETLSSDLARKMFLLPDLRMEA